LRRQFVNFTNGCFFVLFSLSLVVTATAQNFNPPYPRLGVFTFSGFTSASIDILEKYDVIAFPLSNEQARRFKQANPNRIVLRTTDSFTGYQLPINVPDQWRARTADGGDIKLWDGGAYIMNFTRFCPKVDVGNGPETFADWLLRWYRESIDFNYYDGIMHDWWWSALSQGDEVVDFNNNRVPDKNEMNVDELWRESLSDFHKREAQIPGLKYIVVQIGEKWVAPYVNGLNYEDWPDFHGQWIYWKDYHLEEAWEKNAGARQPQIILLDGSHNQFVKYGLGTEPYKNNYRAMRFALGSALMGSAYFYVDEGNDLGHHGNHHYYDEFEAKGMLGQPLGEPRLLPNKRLGASSNCSGVWARYFENGVALVNVSGLDQSITEAELAALDPRRGTGYHRMKGGQDPIFNNGRRVTNADPLKLWGTTVKRHWPENDPVGDGVMLFREAKTLIAPVVVDNNVNNQTSPGSDPVLLTGDWINTNDGGDYYAYYNGRDYSVFQPSGFAVSNKGAGENKAKYVPTIGATGYYEIFEWHGYYGGSPNTTQEARNVPCAIVYSSGQKSVTINQSLNSGRWNSLGTYYFNSGNGGSVTLSNNADGLVLADAIKFVYRGANQNRDSTAPQPPAGLRVSN